MPDTLASSVITEHEFIADMWWSACAICGLSQAAHRNVSAAVLDAQEHDLNQLPYRCPECVWASEFHKPEPHKGECPHDRI